LRATASRLFFPTLRCRAVIGAATNA
jgi:hypothetical protein